MTSSAPFGPIAALLFSLLVAAGLTFSPVLAATAPEPEARPGVVLIGGGEGGQKLLAPLATACAVGGLPVVSLVPLSERGGLEGLVERIARAAEELSQRAEVGEVALVAHGAGGLAAAAYLARRPAGVGRAVFLALPTRGLALPAGSDPCREAWRRRVAAFYGDQVLAQAAPGGKLARALADRGLPPGLLAMSVAGRLDDQAAGEMTSRANCAPELAGLPGDGVVERASIAGLKGFSRSDRTHLVTADHLSLPAHPRTRDLMLRFLRQKPVNGRVAVALVIDASGSVRSSDGQGLRDQAVRLLISRLMAGDRAGVVWFNTKAHALLPLTEIPGRSQAADLARRLPALPAKGDTDIGAGLALAGKMLAAAPQGTRKVVVLLSDGRNDPESANGPTLEAARALVRQGAALYAVGLTDRVDELFLSSLARETGGAYLFAADADQLTAVFDRVQAVLDGRSLLWAGRGHLPAQQKLLVDSTVERLEIGLFSPAADAALEFLGPDGRPVQAARAKGRGYQVYGLDHPAAGLWTLKLDGAAGQPFRAQATAATSLRVRLAARREPPRAGEPWPFALDVTQDELPLADCRARIAARGPGGSEESLDLTPLPPRGFSAGRSNAGVLSGALPPFPRAGQIRLSALVTGKNTWGEPFQRLVLADLFAGDQARERALEETQQGRTLLRRGTP